MNRADRGQVLLLVHDMDHGQCAHGHAGRLEPQGRELRPRPRARAARAPAGTRSALSIFFVKIDSSFKLPLLFGAGLERQHGRRASPTAVTTSAAAPMKSRVSPTASYLFRGHLALFGNGRQVVVGCTTVACVNVRK